MFELLSDEELEKEVSAWVDEDFSVRSIQLNRGHWEYTAPVIAKAEQKNTLKQAAEWAMNICPHGKARRKGDCAICWAELQKVANSE